jgi:hypothetical protein
LQTSISGLQTELPKGTILMYDGTGWQDNITLPGWYCCDLVNRNKGLTPNLEDKFIKGNGSLASTGGSNALTAAMLPKHTHSIYTNATKETDRSKDKELKGTADCAEEDQDRSGIFSFSVEKTYYGWTRGAQDNPRLLIDATHEHTGHANNDNSNTTDSNTSNMPLYYSLIYIRRCA